MSGSTFADMLPPKRSTRSGRTSPEDADVALDEMYHTATRTPDVPAPLPGPEYKRNADIYAAQDSPMKAKSDQVIQSVPSTKKVRRQLTVAQRLALEELASRGSHPSLEARRALAERLGLELKIISVWFQNKRRPTSKLQEETPTDAYGAQPREVLADVNSNTVSERPLCKAMGRFPIASTASSTVFQRGVDFATSPSPGLGFRATNSDCTHVEGASIPVSRQSKRRSLEWACYNDKRVAKRTRTDAQERTVDRVCPQITIPRGRQRTDKKPRKPSPTVRKSRVTELRMRTTASIEFPAHLSRTSRYTDVDEDTLEVAQALLQLRQPLAAWHSMSI